FRFGSAERRTSGGYVLGGMSGLSSGAGVAGALSATGQFEWTKAYAPLTGISRLAPSADGGYIGHGRFGSFASETGVILKLDAQANVTWARELSPSVNSSVSG